MDAQVAEQPSRRQRDDEQQRAQQSHLGTCVVTRELADEDQPAQRDEDQGEHPVEPAGLRVRPGVERAHDLAAVVGVGAALLARAGVADVRAGAVAHETALAVELVRPEVLALRAEPVIVRLVVGEAGGAEAEGAPMCMRREPLERKGGNDQSAGVGRCEHDLAVHTSLADAASSSAAASIPAGWTISVKRMPPSSSPSVTFLTV